MSAGATVGGRGCVTEPGCPATVTAPAFTDLGAAREWLDGAGEDIRAALDRHGALFLRGLPVHTAADFGAVRDSLFTERVAYREKATPRSDFGDDVLSSTDLPASQPIRMHNENSYTLTFPGLLLFGCLTAPAEGGATPVADVRRVLAALPEPLVRRFRETGWSLTRNYAEHISLDWRTAFGVDTEAEVADYCARNQIRHEWCADGHLRTRQTRSALIRHPRTGEELWFNHAAFWNEWALDPDVREVLTEELGRENLPFHTGYGDGTELAEAEVEVLTAAYEAATVRRPWQRGDLLLVDNLLAAHGRDPFRGDRRIVVAMGQPVPVTDCAPTVSFDPAAPHRQPVEPTRT